MATLLEANTASYETTTGHKQVKIEKGSVRHDETTKTKDLFDTTAISDGLWHPGKGTRARLHESSEQKEERLLKMSCAVRTLLECVGEDPDRQDLRDTPLRYAKALLSLTTGYQEDLNAVVNNAMFTGEHDGMVVVRDIDVSSLCEHHLLSFTGKMHIGYIPAGAVIGISKIARIAEMFARRLQIQERLTEQVACALMDTLHPKGVVVVMDSRHLCMVARGVQKSASSTTTRCALGCFKEDKKLLDESTRFINRVKHDSSID